MNYRPKFKSKIYTTLRESMKVNLDELAFDDFIAITPKTQAAKRKKKTDKLDFIRIKNFCAPKNIIKIEKDNPPTERETILQILYIEYILKTHTTQ